MIREKFDRIGRANIMRVSAPRVGSHFRDRVLSDANLAIFDLSESFDPVIEQIVEPSAEAFGLLRSEIVEVKGRILKLTFEPRSVRIPECG